MGTVFVALYKDIYSVKAITRLLFDATRLENIWGAHCCGDERVGAF